MLIRMGFSFQLLPSDFERHFFVCAAGCSRLVWNLALNLQKERLDQQLYTLSFEELCDVLKLWKDERPFLSEVHSQPLQQRLRDLSKALKEALDPENPKQFPRFKKKGEGDSFRYPQGFELDEQNSRIFLPKIGWVRYIKSQNIAGKPKNVTVTQEAGRWYVSIQTELEHEVPIHLSTSVIAGDLGVVHFLTLSNGTHIDAPSYKDLEEKIERAQRQLSLKKKGSHNYQKQTLKLQRLHKQLRDRRNDFLHKLSDQLSKNHAVIVLEKLRVKNMTGSARGTIENPGKNVAQKAGLNRAIMRQGWGEFARQVKYKCEWRGGLFRQVAPEYTSQTCSECDFIHADNRKTQALFVCLACGYTDNADRNAATSAVAIGYRPMRASGSSFACIG